MRWESAVLYGGRRISVIRKKMLFSAFPNSEPWKIVIDGKEVGGILGGEMKSFGVDEKEHELYVELTQPRGNVREYKGAIIPAGSGEYVYIAEWDLVFSLDNHGCIKVSELCELTEEE